MAALSEVEKLEARYAENPDGRYFAPLADAYRKAGRVDEAITVVTSGLNKHPDYLSAHIVLGRCFLEKKDDGSAAGAFEKVLSLDGENIIALKSLAEISERGGQLDDSRRWLQRLLVIDAMNGEAAEDLERLGGPLPEAGAQAPAAEPFADDPRVSFADIAAEPVAEAVAASSFEPPMASEPPRAESEPDLEVPRTLERLAVRHDLLKMATDQTMDLMPAVPPPDASPSATERMPALDFESTSFTPPAADEVAPAPDFIALDEHSHGSLEPRESVHAAFAPEPEPEPLAPAIDFMMSEPAPPLSQEKTTEVPAMRLSGLGLGRPSEPEPQPAAAMEQQQGGDLHLIMPEDVTPAEELRRPSSKQVQMVSPEPSEAEVPAGVELMVTETMGDLYLRQGHKDHAAEVYRRLLRSRPSDAGLQAKLKAIESPPAFSAAAMGSEAVGSWLRRIAQAQLPMQAASSPPAPDAGLSPMEQAFAAPEPEPEAAPATAASESAPAPAAEPPAGEAARPATDAFSLDQIFGGPGGQAPAPAAPAPTTALGASFDEFFGTAPKQETVRPKEGGGTGTPRQSEDDLSAFNTWLHGLKR